MWYVERSVHLSVGRGRGHFSDGVHIWTASGVRFVWAQPKAQVIMLAVHQLNTEASWPSSTFGKVKRLTAYFNNKDVATSMAVAIPAHMHAHTMYTHTMQPVKLPIAHKLRNVHL